MRQCRVCAPTRYLKRRLVFYLIHILVVSLSLHLSSYIGLFQLRLTRSLVAVEVKGIENIFCVVATQND